MFNSNLRYVCQIWGQDQSEEFKKIEKIQEKAIRIINFLPLNAPQLKNRCMKWILKLKDFIMLQNMLLVKDCLSENAPGSCNDKFHPSKLPLTTQPFCKFFWCAGNGVLSWENAQKIFRYWLPKNCTNRSWAGRGKLLCF